MSYYNNNRSGYKGKSWYDDDDYYSSNSKSYNYNSNYYRTSNMGFSTNSRKTYSNNYNWDWSSYVPFKSFTEEESNKNLFVTEHQGYLTPDTSMVKSRFNQFVSDKLINLTKDLSRMFYYQLLDDPNFLKGETEIDPSLVNEYQQFIQIKDKFYPKLDVPGNTPLEKAVNVITILSEEGKVDLSKMSSQQLEKRLEDFHVTDSDYCNPEIQAQMGEIGNKYKNKFRVLNKISLIKNFGSKFKVQKEVEEKIVHNSPIIAIKRMTSFTQIMNIDLYQRLLPNFNLKLALKDLNVKVPIDKTEHKQKIIILVDASGSMDMTEKQDWVQSILMDRFRYVIAEEAEVYFSYFEERTFGFHHIKNKADVIKFWRTVYNDSPCGGGTDIGGIIKTLDNEVKSGNFFGTKLDLSEERPEVLIVNDGQDSIHSNSFEYKVNAITLMSDNSELKNLCLNSKGKYIHVNNNNEVKQFEK